MLTVVLTVVSAALALTVLAVWGIERKVVVQREPDPTPFVEGLREIWAERNARNFTLFVFLSMNAYFMQELILEPFAGLVFEFTPGQSTKLSGAQNGGVFAGMLTVGIVATGLKFGALRHWVVAGCIGSAVALVAIAMAGVGSLAVPLFVLVVGLGFFNGMFAVAAIGSMMALASEGRGKREGTRMGLWGAAQAIAAGFGGLLGAAAVDVMRLSVADGPAFGVVFLGEAGLFLAAAFMALHVMKNERVRGDAPLIVGE